MKKVYKFYADWCPPCKVLSRNLEGFERDGWDFEEVNADADVPKMRELGVRKLPTLVFVDEKGEVLDRVLGVISKEELQMRLNEFDKGGDSTN